MAERLTRKKRAEEVIRLLHEAFPDACCSLDTDLPERLAIRGILSAQCTDKRVNITASELFGRYPDMEQIDNAPAGDISEVIKPCGLTASKTAAVKDFAHRYQTVWNGRVPDDPDLLMECKGIGRKIANLIIGEIYGIPAIVVDTHCKRVMFRIGLTDNIDPDKVLTDLNKVIPDSEKIAIGHLAVELGRSYCTSRNPDCASCPLSGICRRKIL
ncbi:MAG: endonuclease III [Clostridiales bacterium]|nr:endonuclease III [Clostridiales bacterium]